MKYFPIARIICNECGATLDLDIKYPNEYRIPDKVILPLEVLQGWKVCDGNNGADYCPKCDASFDEEY